LESCLAGRITLEKRLRYQKVTDTGTAITRLNNSRQRGSISICAFASGAGSSH